MAGASTSTKKFFAAFGDNLQLMTHRPTITRTNCNRMTYLLHMKIQNNDYTLFHVHIQLQYRLCFL